MYKIETIKVDSVDEIVNTILSSLPNIDRCDFSDEYEIKLIEIEIDLDDIGLFIYCTYVVSGCLELTIPPSYDNPASYELDAIHNIEGLEFAVYGNIVKVENMKEIEIKLDKELKKCTQSC